MIGPNSAMAMQYTDVMVDLETTGTQPDRNAIIQLSAVKFNLRERTVCDNFFNRCLEVPPHRFWSESTRNWWLSQDQTIIQEIFERMEDPRKVIEDFVDWSRPTGAFRFWAKPSHFDFNFISSYFSDYGFRNPYHFWEANDMRSYIRGLHAPEPMPDLNVEFVGKAHNALHDTLHQVKVLFAHADEVQKQNS